MSKQTTLSCFPLGNPLKGYNASTVRFSVVFNSDALRGNEGHLEIQLEVLSSNPEADSTRLDNKITVSIRVIASADIATSLQVLPNQVFTPILVMELIDTVRFVYQGTENCILV